MPRVVWMAITDAVLWRRRRLGKAALGAKTTKLNGGIQIPD